MGLELPLASRKAAAWWRSNAPLLMRAGRIFVFHEHVCRVVDDA